MIIVAGLARTGTSAVARVLEQRFGVDMGGPGTVRPQNPDGVYERQWQANADQALEAGHINTVQWTQAIRPRVATLREPFGLKHPFNTYHFGYYLVLYPQAAIIRTVRDPSPVEASWKRTYPSWPKRVIRREVQARTQYLDRVLRDIEHVTVDMNEHRTDDEIVDMLDGYRGLHAG